MWIAVTLGDDEREALIRLAEAERRDPRAQAAVLIRRELVRHGLLPPTDKPTDEPAREGTNR